MLFPKLPSLPTIEMSPVPELIFLSTVKGLLSFVINLSLLDLSLIFIIVLLVNSNPSIRRKAAVSLSVLFLLFGLEISLVNIYALVSCFAVQLMSSARILINESKKVCSQLSPSTTLEPLTIVIMGILNGVMPILTDSILLMHIVIERMEHAKSPWRLAMIMAAPVLLKFGRLANAAIYIAACAEFVLSSVKSGDGIPDMDILDAAQARSMQIACTLQMIDNSSVDYLPRSLQCADNDPNPQLPTRPLLSQRVRATAQGAPRYRPLYVFLSLVASAFFLA